MFDFIASGNVLGLQEHLRALGDQKQINIQLAQINVLGQSLLHAAIEKLDIPMVQELLLCDMSLEVLDLNRQTPLELAESIYVKDKANSTAHKMFCLLKTRQQWQQSTVKFKFNQVVQMLDSALEKISAAKGCSKVLLIGATSAGKSTLINYLCGATYKVGYSGAGNIVANLVTGTELAKTSKRAISETFWPQIIPLKTLNYVYCDLAGMFDNRNIEKRIAVANNIRLLTELPGNIKKIIVVIDFPGLSSGAATSFKQIVTILSKIIKCDAKLLDNVSFVINKVAPNTEISVNEFIAHYVDKILASYQELQDLGERKLNSDEAGLVFILSEMRKRAHQFIVANVADNGATRNKIELDILNTQERLAADFDFLHFDESVKPLHEFLTTIASDYLKDSQMLKFELVEKKQQIKIEVELLDKELIAQRSALELSWEKIIEINRLLGDNQRQIDTNKAAVDRYKIGHQQGCVSCGVAFNNSLAENVEYEQEKIKYLSILQQENMQRDNLFAEEKKLAAKIQDLQDAINTIEGQSQEILISLEVNADVYHKVYNVVEHLSFGSDKIIAKFVEEFEKNIVIAAESVPKIKLKW